MKTLRMALLAVVGLGASLVLYSCSMILHDNRQEINAVVSTATEASKIVIWSSAFGLSVVLAVGPLVGIWWVWHKRQERSRRQEDGSFALQTFGRWGRRIIVDPNRTIEPHISVVPAKGAIIQHAPAAGYDSQLRQNAAVQATRTMQAMVTGDNAASSFWGRDFRPARVLTAGMMREAGKMPKAPEQIEMEPDLLPAPEHKADLGQIVAAAKPDSWPLGYDPETGELAKMRPQEHIHLIIVGATGAGKTKSSAYLVAAYAVRNGWHLIMLDGKGGLDWREFENHGEWHLADASTIARQAQALAMIHNDRLRICREHGVSEIQKIPAGQRPPEILVVIEELGAIMQAMATAPKERKQTESILSQVVATGRSTGIHFMAITTSIGDWPKAFQANAGLKIAYRLGENQGAALSMYQKDVERLKRGEFKVAGEPGVFRSFDLSAELPRLLTEPPGHPRLLPEIEPTGAGEIGGMEDDQLGPTSQRTQAPAPQRHQDEEEGLAERKRAILEWMQMMWATDRTKITARGGQARLFEYLEDIGLRTSKAHISETWREILNQESWHNIDPETGWRDVHPGDDW